MFCYIWTTVNYVKDCTEQKYVILAMIKMTEYIEMLVAEDEKGLILLNKRT